MRRNYVLYKIYTGILDVQYDQSNFHFQMRYEIVNTV